VIDQLNQFLEGLHLLQELQVLNNIQIPGEHLLPRIKGGDTFHREVASDPLHAEPPQCHYQHASRRKGGDEPMRRTERSLSPPRLLSLLLKFPSNGTGKSIGFLLRKSRGGHACPDPLEHKGQLFPFSSAPLARLQVLLPGWTFMWSQFPKYVQP
jgi:hypothetical protein